MKLNDWLFSGLSNFFALLSAALHQLSFKSARRRGKIVKLTKQMGKVSLVDMMSNVLSFVIKTQTILQSAEIHSNNTQQSSITFAELISRRKLEREFCFNGIEKLCFVSLFVVVDFMDKSISSARLAGLNEVLLAWNISAHISRTTSRSVLSPLVWMELDKIKQRKRKSLKKHFIDVVDIFIFDCSMVSYMLCGWLHPIKMKCDGTSMKKVFNLPCSISVISYECKK